MSQNSRGSGANSAARDLLRRRVDLVLQLLVVGELADEAKHERGCRPAQRGADRQGSHRHLGLDVRMRVVALEREILVAEAEDVLHRRIDAHRRQRARRARQLQRAPARGG